MVRILRALDPFIFRTLQRGNRPGQTFGDKRSGDAQVEGIAALVPGREQGKKAVASSSVASKSRIPRS